MQQYESAVISNRELCHSLCELEFSMDQTTEKPLPGQFFTVRVTDSSLPLLRRPFAFAGFDAAQGRARCIYQVRGAATKLLSAMKPDTPLDIIGPLGRPFPLPQPNERPVLIAGGIGLGPVLFLFDLLRSRGDDVRMVFGGRSKEYVPSSLFENSDTVICTDDGSCGFHGTVVDYLATIGPSPADPALLYCCGPQPMLRACHEFASRRSLRCFVSVEQVMACGVGACMGCAVRVNDGRGFVRACKEGPVFDSGEIAWD